MSPPDSKTTGRHRRLVAKAMGKASFAVLSTVSSAGRPHGAGVIYDTVGDECYIHTMRSSRKARNIVESGQCALVVPIRRVPFGPPYTIQFQARAEVIAMDAPSITAAIEAGKLKRLTGHGELDEPDGCFICLSPPRTIHTFGLGVSIGHLIKDPIHNGSRSIGM